MLRLIWILSETIVNYSKKFFKPQAWLFNERYIVLDLFGFVLFLV